MAETVSPGPTPTAPSSADSSSRPGAARAAAPTSMSARAIAPDLARGVMLLFIAIANAPWYLWGDENGMIGSHAAEGSPADLVAQSIALVAIDGRSYPMFAFLFGYGIVQLYHRQHEAGVSHRDARRLLRKRHWWMLAFGFVHALLLWYGDILGAYGLAGLLLCWLFLDRRDTTLRVWAVVLTALLVFGAAMSAVGGVLVSAFAPADAVVATDIPIPDANAEPDYLLAAALRVAMWAVLTPTTAVIGLVIPIAMLVAFVAARHRVLERPAEHRHLLVVTAVVGLAIGWGTGVVLAVQNLGGWGVPRELDWAFLAAHTTGGLFGGLGYIALFGLIAARIERGRPRPGRVAGALQAVGKRSLTCYLAQSVVFAPLLCAWGLGLGGSMTSWSVALLAIAVWLATVVLAVLLERSGRRGPAEWMLRRLAYPRPRH